MGVRAARGFTSLFKIPLMDEDKVVSCKNENNMRSNKINCARNANISGGFPCRVKHMLTKRGHFVFDLFLKSKYQYLDMN